MSKDLKRLIILCGGTGGHFFPGLSVARLFTKRGGKVCLVTGKHKVSYREKYSRLYGIEIFEVNSCQISKNPFKMLLFFLKFISGLFQSVRIYLKEKPDAVLAMGSYTSIPSGMAAVLMKIPLFLHDGNSVIGKANLFLSRWAKLVMTAFPSVNKGVPPSKIFISGMPLRPELVDNKIVEKKEALKLFNSTFNKAFSQEKATVLIFGGSLGAKTINTVIPEAIKLCNSKDLQIIHLTGADNTSTAKKTSNIQHPMLSVRRFYENAKINSLVLERFDDMALLYLVSDLVICRSGGSTVAELEFFDKQAILIPFPHASENHQFYNALYYANQGKADVVEDKNCTDSLIAEKIGKRLKNLDPLQENSVRTKNPTEAVLEKIGNLL